MNIKWMSWVWLIPLMLTTAPAFAWRCQHGLVDAGDAAAAVKEKCGKPDFVYGNTGTHRQGGHNSGEFWYYNQGPSQLLRVLNFRGGVLREINTAGYGFNPSPAHCTPRDVRFGMTVYELVSRCGKPKNKHRSTRSGARKRGHTSSVVTRDEIWTYDFGSQYLLQNITITDGRVQSVETAKRRINRSKLRR